MSNFYIVRASVGSCPVNELRRIHVNSMISVSFFQNSVNSCELSGFINVAFELFRAFNHVFELKFIVNVVFD
jgi:hypothetical protein